MKVIIKNNLLKRIGKADSFDSMKDSDMEGLARKHQLGLHKIIKEDVQVDKNGVMQKEEQLSHQLKPRSVLEREIKSIYTISCTIPKEFWGKDEYYVWQSNSVNKMQDIVAINKLKEEMGILIDLPPFEEGLDNLGTSKLLVEVPESWWEYLKERFNYREETKMNEKLGVKETKRYHIPNLVVHEWIPENDEDIEKLKKMEKTAAVKLSLEKNGVKEDKSK